MEYLPPYAKVILDFLSHLVQMLLHEVKHFRLYLDGPEEQLVVIILILDQLRQTHLLVRKDLFAPARADRTEEAHRSRLGASLLDGFHETLQSVARHVLV